MHALLVIAHGSRGAESNDEIRTLAEKLKSESGNYDLISYGFLELADPDITSSCQQLISQGVTQITVLPYFLVAGKHVTQDVPKQIKQIQSNNPQVKFTIAPYIGSSDVISELVTSHLKSLHLE